MFNSIEWARKYGLRIYLDIHGLPGSQNGWVSINLVGGYVAQFHLPL